MNRLSALWRENRLTIITVLLLGIAFLALRTSPSDVASIESLEADLQRGSPTVLYFYSNT